MHTPVQVALQQADYVAWNIWAAINNRPLLPFKYQHLGTMMSFGSTSGAVKLNLPLPAGAASSRMHAAYAWCCVPGGAAGETRARSRCGSEPSLRIHGRARQSAGVSSSVDDTVLTP
jgi:hypothetical protein